MFLLTSVKSVLLSLFLVSHFLHPFLQALQERMESLQKQLHTAEKKLMSRELETQEQVQLFCFFTSRDSQSSGLPNPPPLLSPKGPDEVLLKVTHMYPRTFLTLLKNQLQNTALQGKNAVSGFRGMPD